MIEKFFNGFAGEINFLCSTISFLDNCQFHFFGALFPNEAKLMVYFRRRFINLSGNVNCSVVSFRKRDFLNSGFFLLSMDNFLLMKRTDELELLSRKLGFDKILFLESGLVLITTSDKKKLLQEIKVARQKGFFTIYQPRTEEMLRFAMEKTPIDIVVGFESINPKDSLHYVRSGLDQIYCRIAKEKNKILGFSFSEILNSSNQSKLIARMTFNLKLARKYQLKVIFGNFSREKDEMRSAKDLEAFFRVLGGNLKKAEISV